MIELKLNNEQVRAEKVGIAGNQMQLEKLKEIEATMILHSISTAHMGRSCRHLTVVSIFFF